MSTKERQELYEADTGLANINNLMNTSSLMKS